VHSQEYWWSKLNKFDFIKYRNIYILEQRDYLTRLRGQIVDGKERYTLSCVLPREQNRHSMLRIWLSVGGRGDGWPTRSSTVKLGGPHWQAFLTRLHVLYGLTSAAQSWNHQATRQPDFNGAAGGRRPAGVVYLLLVKILKEFFFTFQVRVLNID